MVHLVDLEWLPMVGWLLHNLHRSTNPHLCWHFVQENLIFPPNIVTVLAWLALLFHFGLQVFPLLYMMMVILSISDIHLLLVLVSKFWCHLECELIAFLDHLVSDVDICLCSFYTKVLHQFIDQECPLTTCVDNIANDMTSLFHLLYRIFTGTTHILKTVKSPVWLYDYFDYLKHMHNYSSLFCQHLCWTCFHQPSSMRTWTNAISRMLS